MAFELELENEYMPKIKVIGVGGGGGNAVNTDGSARVTFLRKNDVPVIFNGEQVEDVVLNGVKLTGMMVDGIRLYMKKRREKRCFA